jgi:predicted ATPase/DNA-binding CsgD family transcriptional regulator
MARPARRPGNLPAELTSFVGRRGELTEVRRKLTEARLVSLIGPGGVGKTRLGIRAAADLGRGFPDGSWLVELADVRQPALVGNAVVAALDLRDHATAGPEALLLSYLRDKRLLLVVDNCEHLLAGAASLLAAVLTTAPGVRVIATSREPLSVPGEHVVPVPPLDLPTDDPTTPLAKLRQNEAITLFTERAVAGSGGFTLTDANRTAVVDLCHRLDGLPLAIELAAVRTRVLTAQQILDRLTDRFGLLTGGGRTALPRHQTLRTTIDWSHDLLGQPERTLLRRLCAFAGRFTIEDVESVCAVDEVPVLQTLDLLSSLVDKSLVLKEDVKDLASFRLHETMREFAGLKAREAGELETVELRCADYYRDSCRRSAVENRYRLAECLAWMDLQIDNVRAVLQGCVARQDIQRGLDIAGLMGWYWMTRATSEGIRWLDTLLGSADGNSPTYALAHFMRGFLSVLQSDPVAARPALDRAVTAAASAGLVSLQSQSLSLASIAQHMAGDHASAARLFDEARILAEGIDDFPASIMLLQARALGGLIEGDLDAVRTAATEGVRRSRDTGDLYSLDMMLVNLVCAALVAGDLSGSGPLLTEALQLAREIDDRVVQYCLLDALAWHAAGQGRPRLGAQLLGAAETVRMSIGAQLLPYLVPAVAQAEKSTKAALGAAAFQAEFDAGKKLSRGAAIGLALGEPVGATALGDAGTTLLGKRQTEVAHLVADGLTNKQIATRLLISEHTVDSHIRHIMDKLGVNSRTQIAAWMVSGDQ